MWASTRNSSQSTNKVLLLTQCYFIFSSTSSSCFSLLLIVLVLLCNIRSCRSRKENGQERVSDLKTSFRDSFLVSYLGCCWICQSQVKPFPRRRISYLESLKNKTLFPLMPTKTLKWFVCAYYLLLLLKILFLSYYDCYR